VIVARAAADGRVARGAILECCRSARHRCHIVSWRVAADYAVLCGNAARR